MHCDDPNQELHAAVHINTESSHREKENYIFLA